MKKRVLVTLVGFLLSMSSAFADDHSKPVPIKKGFYIRAFLGWKSGGRDLHDELHSALKNSAFKGADLFCIEGPKEGGAFGIEEEKYWKKHPIPIQAGACKGAAYVMAGPFQTLDEAKSKAAEAEVSMLHTYADIIQCNVRCDEIKKQ